MSSRSSGDTYLEANRARWDELVAVHARSAFYDLEGFLAGRSSLTEIERAALGDVTGKTLLHLQCHFGMDTLSWARLGAQVTGVDFSAEAIALARSLSERLGLPARFLCSDLYDLPAVLDEQFDLVFTSYGVLVWLPDLGRWVEVVARSLKPGGTFLLVEMHPFAHLLDPDADEPRVSKPYFGAGQPRRFSGDGSYADRAAKLEHDGSYEWTHTLSEVIGALLAAGLQLEAFEEHAGAPEQILAVMEQGAGGWWHLPAGWPSLPLLFLVKARK